MSENSFPNPFNTLTAFVLPKDRQQLKAQYWTPNDASKAWGCSRSTAYRLIDRYETELRAQLIWVVRPNRTEMWRVIPANSERPTPPKGNPAFREPERQRETARAREMARRVHGK